MKALKNILIIGGTGFIGRYLTLELLNKGHNIKVVDLIRPDWLPSKVTFYKTSFTTQSDELELAFNNTDIVYHLASTTLPQTSNDDIVFDIESNLLGSLNLLNYAVKYNVEKFIFASSGGTVYGDSDNDITDEGQQTNPISSYGIVKLAVEKYLNLYSRKHGISTCALRISNPYGTLQDSKKVQGIIPIFMRKIIDGQPIEVWGDGSIARDFIYIDDLVSGMVKCLDVDFNHEVLNLSSGISTSINDIVELIENSLNKKSNVTYKMVRDSDVKYICLSNNRAKMVLDWNCTTTVKDGIIKISKEIS